MVHPPQEEKAQELFEKIEARLQSLESPKPLDAFTDMKFLLHVPNLNSLYNQTCVRLCQFQKSRPLLPKISIVKNNNGEAEKKVKNGFIRSVSEHPKTLHLLVRDECHFEATHDGAAAEFLNYENIRNPPHCNVVTVFVSATPYNMVSRDSQIPEKNEVKWDSQIPSATSEVRYFGLAHFENQENMWDKNEDQWVLFSCFMLKTCLLLLHFSLKSFLLC
jgi:hypothetical protein